MSNSNTELATNCPDLIKLSYTPEDDRPDSVWLDPKCDTAAMRNDAAFMNDFSKKHPHCKNHCHFQYHSRYYQQLVDFYTKYY